MWLVARRVHTQEEIQSVAERAPFRPHTCLFQNFHTSIRLFWNWLIVVILPFPPSNTLSLQRVQICRERG